MPTRYWTVVTGRWSAWTRDTVPSWTPLRASTRRRPSSAPGGLFGKSCFTSIPKSFVDALEKIARGERDMLPPFSSREEQLQKEIDHLGDTHRRFRDLVSGLTAEQLGQPVTLPNPINSFPGLTLLELVERVSGHEATHSRQIELTRKYVEAFRSKERAVSVITLGDGSPERLSEGVEGPAQPGRLRGWQAGCPCRGPANGPGCGIDHHRRKHWRNRLPSRPGSPRGDMGSGGLPWRL